MKDRTAPSRWADVLPVIGCLMPVALACGLGSVAHAAETLPKPVEEKRPMNAIIGSATFPIPNYGVALAYDRGLGRRFSVGATVEYVAPRVGYSHLVGMSESIGGKVWLKRPLHGLFGEVTFGLAHTTLYRAPMLGRLAVAPGVGTGFRWQFDFGLILGASAALRFSKDIGGSPLVCTRPEFCPATRSGIYARLGLDVGWAF